MARVTLNWILPVVGIKTEKEFDILPWLLAMFLLSSWLSMLTAVAYVSEQ
jgi:hypothetical protein